MKLTDEQIAFVRSFERDGRLNPVEVLAAAKQPDSPIHELYDWNLARAAEQQWMAVTREIVRAVRIEVRTTQYVLQAPFYVRDVTVAPRSGYVSLPRLRVEPNAAEDVLRREVERVRSQLQRARAIAAALGREGEIDDLLLRVGSLISSINPGETVTEVSPS